MRADELYEVWRKCGSAYWVELSQEEADRWGALAAIVKDEIADSYKAGYNEGRDDGYSAGWDEGYDQARYELEDE